MYAAGKGDGSILVTKTVTFTGGAGAGAIGTFNIFMVTGDVALCELHQKTTTVLVGATATLSFGVTGLTTQWANGSPVANYAAGTWGDGAVGVSQQLLGINGESMSLSANVIGTVATAAITSGVLVFYARYRPLSAGSSLVAA